MARSVGALAVVLSLLVVACGGSSPTLHPTPASSQLAPSAPEATASPTPSSLSTASVTALPNATTPNSTETAPTAPPPAAWSELTDAGPGPSAREDQTWTVDQDGTTGYLFGGLTAQGSTNDLWAFDLAGERWTQVEPATDAPGARFGHTATWVPDVGLVVWSGQGTSAFFDDIWAYDPETNSWTQLPSGGAVPEARYGSCAALGPDGELWISHGFTEDNGRFADTRSYNFAAGTWTDRTPTGDVPVKRCLHDCFWSESGQLVLYGGQTTGVAAIGDAWSLDPVAGVWHQGPAAETPPRQLYALTTVFNHRGLVFGGGTLDGGYLNDAWIISDPSVPRLDVYATLSSPSPRAGATMVTDATANRVLLFGGRDDSGKLGDLWELLLP